MADVGAAFGNDPMSLPRSASSATAGFVRDLPSCLPSSTAVLHRNLCVRSIAMGGWVVTLFVRQYLALLHARWDETAHSASPQELCLCLRSDAALSCSDSLGALSAGGAARAARERVSRSHRDDGRARRRRAAAVDVGRAGAGRRVAGALVASLAPSNRSLVRERRDSALLRSRGVDRPQRDGRVGAVVVATHGRAAQVTPNPNRAALLTSVGARLNAAKRCS